MKGLEGLIGQTLGQYRIVEQIGTGGMATVFKAYQPGLDRYVAIKVLPPLYADQPGFSERFVREAQAIAHLHHPNILPVHDFGQERGYSFIVMRYVEGARTLREVMKQPPLSLATAADLIGQVAAALDHAHARQIIHRDVKPANVLMDGDWALLSDFGLARMTESTMQLTGPGVGIGTPAYMSPEQGQALPVDHRTDIYSLGIILFEMLTGQIPHNAETPFAIILKRMSEPLPLPRSFNPAIPESVEWVILKALARDPNDRFDSAGAMAAALQQATGEVTDDEIKVTLPVVASPTKTLLSARPGADREPPTMPAVAPISARAGPPWQRMAGIGAVVLVVALSIGWLASMLDDGGRPTITPTSTPEAAATPPAVIPTATPASTPTSPPPTHTPTATPTPTPSPTLTPSPTPEPTITPPTPTPTPTPGATRTADGMVIIYVPAGEFTMGSLDGEGQSDEHPQRTIYLDSFWIDQTEVTNAQYRKCVEAGKCQASGYADDTRFNGGTQPVVGVNWNDAQAYCVWAGARLPTEAEWEKAARGTDGRIYPWGNEWDAGKLNSAEQGPSGTTVVGSFPAGASPYGALDMAGNVREWVADRYAADYYRHSPGRNPPGPDSGDKRVLRGGAWCFSRDYARVAFRLRHVPDYRNNSIGVRCASDLP